MEETALSAPAVGPAPGARARGLPSVLGWAVVCAVLNLTWAAFFLGNGSPSIMAHVTEVSSYFAGGERPEVVTWPMWGYALLLRVVPSRGGLVALQIAVAACGQAWLLVRMKEGLAGRGWWLLVPLALPWYATHGEPYPQALAGSFALLGLLVLGSPAARISMGVLAGVCFGLSQNFRSEMLWLPACLLLLGLLVRRWPRFSVPPIGTLAACVVTSLALQLPWALFYHRETGRMALAESNLGHVAVVGLGQLPSNPWGFVADDAGAQEILEQRGYELSSLGEPGNRILSAVYMDAIRSHPAAAVKAALHRLKFTVMVPYNVGELRLSRSERLALDAAREHLKDVAGLAVNQREARQYRDLGLWDLSATSWRVRGALLYQVAGLAGALGLFVCAVAGLLVYLRKGSSTENGPLLFCFAGALAYKMALNVVLFYGSFYQNSIFLCGLPFAALALGGLGQWAAGLRTSNGWWRPGPSERAARGGE
jgi:hypothetical protein